MMKNKFIHFIFLCLILAARQTKLYSLNNGTHEQFLTVK